MLQLAVPVGDRESRAIDMVFSRRSVCDKPETKGVMSTHMYVGVLVMMSRRHLATSPAGGDHACRRVS